MSLKQTANRNRGECCRAIKPFDKKPTQTLVVVIAMTWLAVPPATGAQSQTKGKEPAPRSKIRLATAAPSLSHLPIYVAIQKGFFSRFDFSLAAEAAKK